MNADQLRALLEAANGADGTDVEFDGLGVELADDGYRVETPRVTHEGLDEAGLRSVCEENPWFVSNWYYWEVIDRPDADRAFLRWLEDADEASVPDRYEALAERLTRTWGQLLVRAELGDDGHRRYHVRHEADAGADLATLTVRADPYEARDIVKYDDRGRYRPLKTAPTLPTGWAFTDLDGRDLVELVDLIYPATVANWHRERRGELDVTHYRETARRQTGIYDLIDELPPESVEWLAEACCVDSQCLKRREWDEDEETQLAVPRGEGEFPCREPCSLVVAAARKWTLLEREERHTYEFELTPGEKRQLEELVDAVADGRTDDIREADFSDGANRYRARYLRAKLFDEAGRLAGVPTDQTDGGPEKNDQ